MHLLFNLIDKYISINLLNLLKISKKSDDAIEFNYKIRTYSNYFFSGSLHI